MLVGRAVRVVMVAGKELMTARSAFSPQHYDLGAHGTGMRRLYLKPLVEVNQAINAWSTQLQIIRKL